MNKIAEIRKEKGITQEHLAVTAGLTQACISQIESGKRMSNIRTMIRIADALGVTLNDLIDWR